MRKYIQIDISEELHRDLKTATSRSGRSIKAALIDAIEKIVKKSKASEMGAPFID